jgi:hypothetical protein
MALLRTRSTFQGLAAALRAGDDPGAARLAAELGVPTRHVTHRGLGPGGSVPAETAADALAVVAALAAPASGRGKPADPAVLDRASRGWRGLTMTADGLRLLQDLRRSLLEPPRQLRPQPATVTQPDDQPSTVTAVA